MHRVLIFLFIAFTASGCSAIKAWDHTRPPLTLQILPSKLSLQVGESFPVRFILRNTSSRPIEACFGTPWQYTILADHFPLESQANIKTANIHGMKWIVDHPSCVEKRFHLDPNEVKEWSEDFTALDVQY